MGVMTWGIPMPIRPENRNRYPADWKLRSRFVRFYRAKNRCEGCGAINGKPHPVTGSRVVLTVAHVYDDRPEASGLLNLAAWCQRCHNRHDGAARAAGKRQRREAASGQMALCLGTIEGGLKTRFAFARDRSHGRSGE